MSSVVVSQVAMRGEGTPTVWITADKGLFSIVDALVRLEVSFLSEFLATAWEVADEGLFA